MNVQVGRALRLFAVVTVGLLILGIGRAGLLAVRAPRNRFCTGRVGVRAGGVAGRLRVPFTG